MKQSTLILLTLCALIITMTFATATAWLDVPSPQPTVSAMQVAKQPTKVDTEEDNEEENSLPTVGSYQKLKQLLAEMQRYHGTASIAVDAVVSGSMSSPSSAPAMKEVSRGAKDVSSTNVQVAGVDEADVVKTDGTYLYQAADEQVIISQIHPVEEMKVLSRLSYEQPYYPLELYVDEHHLVVIGQTRGKQVYDGMPRNMVKAIVYDIRDRSKPQQLRAVELEGNYVSSRKIDTSLYLVSNQYIDYYYIMNERREYPAPVYYDTASGQEAISIDYKDISYFPNFREPTYLFVAGLDLAKPEQPLDVSSFLGATDNIYASTQHLYLAASQTEQPEVATKSIAVPPGRMIAPQPPLEKNTTIFKFALDSGKTKYLGSGEVPGTILNQFSMDEYNGYFRIATTTGDIWREDEHTSKNHLFILDENLQIRGKVEDIAPGERIYSVRFIGERAYMVTFKNTDPLFVIDVKDPDNPRILGALKIPGYSDYLHPYDENHLIGFGKDTIELDNKEFGVGAGPTAFYLGMKIAMFDVTDVNNPVEKHKLIIGDRGTESDLLHNHKALLFSKEKQLMAFPVTLYEITGKQTNSPSGQEAIRHGEFVFQGAYIYKVSAEDGFTLQKRITHLTDEDYRKAGTHWYDHRKNVQRMMYIGDTLYTLSPSQIKAHDLRDFSEQGSLMIAQP